MNGKPGNTNTTSGRVPGPAIHRRLARAGSLCWHVGGVTDSFGDDLAVLDDGLGLLPYCNGVHDDLGDLRRRIRYRRSVADGTLPSGYATEDGVALH